MDAVTKQVTSNVPQVTCLSTASISGQMIVEDILHDEDKDSNRLCTCLWLEWHNMVSDPLWHQHNSLWICWLLNWMMTRWAKVVAWMLCSEWRHMVSICHAHICWWGIRWLVWLQHCCLQSNDHNGCHSWWWCLYRSIINKITHHVPYKYNSIQSPTVSPTLKPKSKSTLSKSFRFIGIIFLL